MSARPTFIALVAAASLLSMRAHAELHEMDLYAERTGLVRLVLPDEVLRSAAAGLDDVRVLDRQGATLAFGLDPPPTAEKPPRPLVATPIVEVRREVTPRTPVAQPSVREEYEFGRFDFVPPDSHWELVVSTGRPEFVRTATVSSGGKSESASIFRVGGAEQLRIASGTGRGPALHVLLEGREDFFLDPTFHVVSSSAPPAALTAKLPLAVAYERAEEGVTIVELERPPALVPIALRIATATPSFVRRVEVRDLRAGHESAVLGDARVYRIQLDGADVEELEVPLARAEGQRLEVRIHDGADAPLEALAFEAHARKPALLFLATHHDDGEPDAVLRWGGGGEPGPQHERLDLGPVANLEPALRERLAEIRRAEESVGVRIGASREPTESAPAAPPLAAWMRPGSPVDPALFAMRRTLHVLASPSGVARFRLHARDLAAARADLADVRVVDADDRQWPYLLVDAKQAERVDLEIAREKARSGSQWRIEPRYGPLPISVLELDVGRDRFDRAFTLAARDEHGDERPLAAGRLRRTDERERAPIEIAVGPTRTRELVLRVDDGDEAPLELGRARAHVPTSVLLVLAPRGDYVMLLGDPDAAAPQYEVASERERVLAATAGRISAGLLEPNPAYRVSARLAAAGRNERVVERAWIWATLVAVVAGLALLTLRTARRSTEADPVGRD